MNAHTSPRLRSVNITPTQRRARILIGLAAIVTEARQREPVVAGYP